MQPNSTAIVVIEDSLDTIADRINDAVFNAESAARSAMQYALEAGALLNQAKKKVGHGEFKNWLVANVRLAPRTCQAYMRLATKVQLLPAEEAQRVTDLPVRKAIHAITTTPTGPLPMPDPFPVPPAMSPEQKKIVATLRKTANSQRRLSGFICRGNATSKDVDRVRKMLKSALASLETLEVADAA